MNQIFPIADQAVACLKRLNFDHPAFDNCDTSSLQSVADRIRANITTTDLPDSDGMNLTIGRVDETPDELITRCLGNNWRVVGHEYQLANLNFNASPDPTENSRGYDFGEWTWQLNRHHEWLVAALLHHRSGDPRAIQALSTWIRIWVETCPAPTRKFNTELTSWRTIEIGIRLGGVWPHVFNVIRNADAFDDELLLAWLNSVAEQCDFVWANRKTKNWLMMEMNGLLTAALMFPFFASAADWEANALRVYIEEIDKQFLADGMQVELSAAYHGVSFLQYLRGYKFLKSIGRNIPVEFISGMRKMLNPWRAMVRPDGQVFGFQDSVPVNYPNWLRQLPGDIQAPDDAFFSRGGPEPGHRNDLLPNTGQGVLRSGWTMNDTVVAIDAGPFGEAHQHEDKLSIQIWSRGRDLLGEAGVVNYADSPQRRYSLETLAHSTAIVDGLQQNSRRLFHANERPLDALADVTCNLESTTPWIKGTYKDGYGPEGEVAVRHERTVMLDSANLITITDRFCADDATPHTVEILFHLLKDGFDVLDNGTRSTGEGPNLLLNSRRTDGGPFAVTGICGGTAPDLRGWAAMDAADYKGSYELVPRPCITITARMSWHMVLVTEINILD